MLSLAERIGISPAVIAPCPPSPHRQNGCCMPTRRPFVSVRRDTLYVVDTCMAWNKPRTILYKLRSRTDTSSHSCTFSSFSGTNVLITNPVYHAPYNRAHTRHHTKTCAYANWTITSPAKVLGAQASTRTNYTHQKQQ